MPSKLANYKIKSCERELMVVYKFEPHGLYVKGFGAAAVPDKIKAAMKNFAELINP